MSTCKFCKVEGGGMISCATCKGYCHPSCLELPEHIVPVVRTYDWQCNDCKYCYECHNIENEQKILFCDSCDRGYHTYCVKPRLTRKPRGDWYCAICRGEEDKQKGKQPEGKPSYKRLRHSRGRYVSSSDEEEEMEIEEDKDKKEVNEVQKEKETKNRGGKKGKETEVKKGKEVSQEVKDVKEAQQEVKDVKEAQPNVITVKEAQQKVKDVKEAQQEVKDVKEAQLKVKNVEEAQPKDKDAKEAQPKVKDVKEAQPKVKNVEEAQPKVKNVEEAQPKVKDIKDAQPKVKDIKEAQQKVKDIKEAQQEDKDIKEAQQKVKDVKEAQQEDRDVKVQQKVKNVKEAQTKVNVKESQQEVKDIKEVQQKVKNIKETKPKVPDVNVEQEVKDVKAQEKVKDVNEAQPKVKEVKDAQPKGKEIKDAQPKGKEIKEAQPKGKEIKEAQPKGKEIKEAQPKGKEVKEAQPKVKEVKEAQPNVKEVNEVQQEVKDVKETQQKIKGDQEEVKMVEDTDKELLSKETKVTEIPRELQQDITGRKEKEKKKDDKKKYDTQMEEKEPEKEKVKKETKSKKKDKGNEKDNKKKDKEKENIVMEKPVEHTTVSDIDKNKNLQQNDNILEKENIITPNKQKGTEKIPKKSVEKSTYKKSDKCDKNMKEKGKKQDVDLKFSHAITQKDNTPEHLPIQTDNNNESIEQIKSSKKKCVYGKKFGESHQCPFYGCDGKGNTRNNHNFHLSLNNCPLSKESRKRERELMNYSKDESSPSPPRKKVLQGSPEIDKIKECKEIKDFKKDKETVSQMPIENIVSNTDIELFEQAKSKAVMALCQEMAPSPDGLKSIIFGDVEINVWYKSQYTIEYSRLPKLYICEFCLSYMKTRTIYERHMAKCKLRSPPGDEIYRKDNHSVFEVNGATATAYCQNLCLMAKLFLDHKTLWLDVAPFLFYIMTVNDQKGCHIVGYFSKEKVSFLNYNVSCILVLPHHMKKGYGRLLIDFSYLLTAAEGKTGSPERPLSDMGLLSYRKFWAEKLLKYLIDYQDKEISVKSISETMAIQATDVISTLQYLGVLKYWKGKHLILLRKEVIVEYALKVKGRPEDYKEIDATCLTWTAPNYKPQ